MKNVKVFLAIASSVLFSCNFFFLLFTELGDINSQLRVMLSSWKKTDFISKNCNYISEFWPNCEFISWHSKKKKVVFSRKKHQGWIWC